MPATRSPGRLVGALLIVQLAGFIVPFVLLLPITTGPEGYLANAVTVASQIRLAVVLLLVNGALTVAISSSVFPVVRQHSEPMALALLAAGIVMLLLQAADNVHVLSMLSLSQRYGSAGTTSESLLELATAVGTTRKWAHYTELLAIDCWIFLFYLVLFRFTIAPRPLAAFGLLCVSLHFLGIPARGFLGLGPITPMGMPMAVSHVLIGGWLMARRPGHHGDTENSGDGTDH
jgi:hypothetical protein